MAISNNSERATRRVAPTPTIIQTSAHISTQKVERVIDGDTFETNNKQIIRLASIDAPEIGLCGSKEAKEFLETLILSKEVKIQGELNDSRGRLLAVVYQNGKLINDELIKVGWAEYLSQDSGVNEILKKSGQEAREKKIGIFSELCRQTTPPDPKCDIKGNIKDGHKIYFYPGCGNYSNVLLELNHGDQWFCSEAEAKKAGFVKSGNCHK